MSQQIGKRSGLEGIINPSHLWQAMGPGPKDLPPTDSSLTPTVLHGFPEPEKSLHEIYGVMKNFIYYCTWIFIVMAVKWKSYYAWTIEQHDTTDDGGIVLWSEC